MSDSTFDVRTDGTAMLRVRNQAGPAPFAGRSFTVRIVREGDRYGYFGGLIAGREADGSADECFAKRGPLIEFYDATYAEDPRFELGAGQFVSRYYAETLRSDRPVGGLNLDAGIDVWTVDGAAMAVVLMWLDNQLGA